MRSSSRRALMTALVSQLFPLLAAASLGLLAGALLAEDRLLVPYWRTLSAETFYALHPTFGPMLYRFFAPLTMAAPPAAVLAMVQVTLQSGGLTPRSLAAIAMAVLTCSLVAIYFLYFKSANEALLRRAVCHGPANDFGALGGLAPCTRFHCRGCLRAVPCDPCRVKSGTSIISGGLLKQAYSLSKRIE
jgi:hypothetical protein